MIQMFGQSSSERWRCSGASFILTCVYAPMASLACPEQLGNLEMTSKTSAAVICDAEAPCSVNTAQFPESSFAISPLNTTRPFLKRCLQFRVLVMTQVLMLLFGPPLLYWSRWTQAGSFCNVVHSKSRAASAWGIVIAVGMGIGLCTMLQCVRDVVLMGLLFTLCSSYYLRFRDSVLKILRWAWRLQTSRFNLF